MYGAMRATEPVTVPVVLPVDEPAGGVVAGGLFGFILTPAPEAAVNALLDELKLFGLGFSWGGFESLAISCDHQLPNRSLLQTYDGPVMRLHIGLESPEDLIEDLRAGLDAFNRARA